MPDPVGNADRRWTRHTVTGTTTDGGPQIERGSTTFTGRPRLPHVPALDGYRGIGVATVVAFHFGLLPGGWLGVDLFFVLSGFLITRIVTHERANDGRIDLVNFWRRRARRLLPALICVLAGVALYLWWYPEKIALPANLPTQMWATIFYVANWATILAGDSYWAQYSVESPLRHMWSLAIEEQFYILFPLVMTGLFAIVRRRVRIGSILLGAAVASWTLGVVLLATKGDFERVYLGTDTRIGAILLGASAGYLSCFPSQRVRMVSIARWSTPFAVAVMTAAFVLVDGEGAWSAPRWLVMPAFEFAVVLVLLAALPSSTDRAEGAAEPLRGWNAVLDGIVTSRLLVWLGAISYGLYLWHIPVKLWVERAMEGSPRPVVIVTAIAVSLAISALSLRFVERPIRLRGLSIAPRGTLIVAAIILLAGSVTMTTAATAPARERADRPSTESVDNIIEVDDLPDPDPIGTSTLHPDGGGSAPPTDEDPPVELGVSFPLERPEGRPTRILLLGDSLARDITPTFTEEASQRDMVVSASSLVGCGLGGNVVSDNGADWLTPVAVERCDEWRAGQSNLVSRTGADVVIVFRQASRAPREGLDWCDSEYLDWYANALNDEITGLSATGATVVIIGLAYPRYGGTTTPTADDRVDCLNPVIEKVVESRDDAVMSRLDRWVCPSRDNCIAKLDGVLLRTDGMHFEGQGGTIASRWLLDEMFG